MRINPLKLSIIVLFGAFAVFHGLAGRKVSANSSGPPLARSGAPGELTCATSDCHGTSPLNSGGGTFTITGLPTNYTLGQDVTVAVTLTQANRGRYGFELTAIDDQGRAAGTFVLTDTNRTQPGAQAVGGNLRRYVVHTFNGSTPSGTNQGRWTFTWRPPTTAVGRITFYAAGNAANNNGTESGDFIYTTSVAVQPPAAVGPLGTVSAASFASNGMLAPDSIGAAFGSGLSSAVAVADGVPLPQTLAEASLRIRDSAGVERTAGLFFAAPTQINFHVPEGLASGAATISVVRGGNVVAQGPATIDRVSPGLFAANANGQGVAAAVVFRLAANGAQTFEPVNRFDSATSRFVPVPINLGPAGDQLFLLAFGTGIKGAGALSAVTATIGGAASDVSFAGAAPGLIGTDQVNMSIPRSLGGRGDVNVALTVDGKNANVVTINVQ